MSVPLLRILFYVQVLGLNWYQVPGGSAFQKKRDAFAWLDGNVIKENSVNLNVFRHLSTYKHKCPSTALHNNRDVW